MCYMDMCLYQQAFFREMKGDIMCRTLDKLKLKTPKEILIESGQWDRIPVNVDVILNTFGVKRISSNFLSLEERDEYKNKGEILGLVLLQGDDVGLFYKKTDSSHRKRFTVAHELGHCSLHSESLLEGYVEFRDETEIGVTKEIEANTFAGELLIPEHSLRYVINRLVVPTIQGLADIFDVSLAVMRKRLELLKIPYYDDILDRIIEPR